MTELTVHQPSDLVFCDRHLKKGLGAYTVGRQVRALFLTGVAVGICFGVESGLGLGFVGTLGWLVWFVAIVWSFVGSAVLSVKIVSRLYRALSWGFRDYGRIAKQHGFVSRFCWSRLQMVLEGVVGHRFLRVHAYDSDRHRRFYQIGKGQGWCFEILVPFHRALPTGIQLESQWSGRPIDAISVETKEISDWNLDGLLASADSNDDLQSLIHHSKIQEGLRWFLYHRRSVLDAEGLALTLPDHQSPENLYRSIEQAYQFVCLLESVLDEPWERAGALHGLMFHAAPVRGYPKLEGRLLDCAISVEVNRLPGGPESGVETLVQLVLPPSGPDWTLKRYQPGHGIRTGNPIIDSCLSVESTDEADAIRRLNDPDLSVRLIGLIGTYPSTTFENRIIRVRIAGCGGHQLAELIGDLQEIASDLQRLGTK